MKNLTKFIGLALLTITLAFTTVDKKTIIIDVSHGGHDNGMTSNRFSEKEIALNIAKKIKELNKNSNVEIVLTRDTDKFVTLNERAKQINEIKPDFVISLHANAHDNKIVSGKKIFVSRNNKQKEKSGNLALDLFYSFNSGSVKITNANFYLLKMVEYPIVYIELGNLNNENDQELLTTEKGQSELAESILKVIN